MLRLYRNTMDNYTLSLGMIIIMGILAKNTASAIRVTTDPEVFVQRDTRANLKCEFNHKGSVSTLTWSKGPIYEESEVMVKFFLGFKMGPKYKKGYDLAPDNKTLIIEKVTEEDAGTWWCYVVVTDPWTESRSTNLTVIVPPKPPTISQCPNEQPCEIEVDKDDTNYTVTCTSPGTRPPATLAIYKDNERINVNPQQRTNSENPAKYDTVLETPVALDLDKDEFIITCEAIGHSTLPEGDQRAHRVLKIHRSRNDPSMGRRQEDTPEEGIGTNLQIGIYVGVGAVCLVVFIICIFVGIFIIRSKIKLRRAKRARTKAAKTRYKGAKKKKKKGNNNRPRFPSPPPSPGDGRTPISSIHSLGRNGDSDSEKHDYENLPKGYRNGLCAKSPVYQSPVSAC